MKGEQLERFIWMLHDLLDDLEEKSPDLARKITDKQNLVTLLDNISFDERSAKEDEDISESLATFALSKINEVVVGTHGKRIIDYSPMHGLIAKYGLKLSNVCEYLGITSNIRTSISKNETVHMDILLQISDFLECDPNELYTFISPEEKARRDMKELLVKESKTIAYRGKEIPIPTAILKEIKDTKNIGNLLYPQHIRVKKVIPSYLDNTAMYDQDGWMELNDIKTSNGQNDILDKEKMNEMIQKFIYNAVKDVNSKQEKENKEE